MSIRQVIVATIVASALAANVHDRSYYEAKFFGWMAEHNIKAENGAKFAQMIQNFANNDDLIEKHNAEKSTYTLGHNQFSHMSSEEWKAYVKGVNGEVPNAPGMFTHNAPRDVSTLAASVDWIAAGAVSGVKDQGQCGSCWAFSATEELESAWILAGHSAVKLAPEQTVDCDQVDQGCNGGDTVSAYAYMQGAGVEAEASYPYTAGDSGNAGTCTYDASAVVAKPTGFTYATPGCSDSCTNQNEALLKQNLYNVAPASICVDASSWQTYTSGILTAASGCGSAYSDLDHCVQLVGYGVDPSGTAFWSVRNSWASSWGEAGYIRLSYGANTCGVADEATFVQV